MTSKTELLAHVQGNPSPFCNLRNKFGASVQKALTEAVHDGDLFYVYNPHLLVSHLVRGSITWVGAEDRDIRSRDRILSLLRGLTDEGREKLRRRLRYLRFPITEIGEWCYRVFVHCEDAVLARERFALMFAEAGDVAVLPVQKWTLQDWFGFPRIPARWDETDEATRSLLGDALRKLHGRLNDPKNPSPFRGLQFVPEGYIHPRFFYCPSTAQVLVLLAANALAVSKEVKAAGREWKAGDLEQALQPWLEQDDD